MRQRRAALRAIHPNAWVAHQARCCAIRSFGMSRTLNTDDHTFD
jgi:hypothetical protein